MGIVTAGDVASNPSKITDIKFTDIIPQKADIVANGENISKARKRLASSVYPTTRLIRDIATSDTEIFVEDANSFNYEENELGKAIVEFDVLVTEGTDKEFASTEVTVSSASTISSIGILSGGSGYGSGGTIDVKISTPPSGISAGIGTIATATATVSAAGTISSVSITNGGLGYSTTTSPQVLIPLPNPKIETISVGNVEGFSGIITGIGTTTTSGNPAIKFELYNENASFGNTLEVGYPFFVSNSVLGTGVTSLTGAGVIIGIGTTYADNIYEVAEVSISPNNSKLGIVTCRATYEDSSLDYTPNHQLIYEITTSSTLVYHGGNPSNSDYGRAVAVGNDKIVVGAHGAEVQGKSYAGAAFVYDLGGSNEVSITASDPDSFDSFGESVAVGNNKIVVGAPDANVGANADQGAVYVYNLDGTGEVKIIASDGAADDHFGYSVAIANNKIYVGAPYDDSEKGAVYVYDLDGSNEVKQTSVNAAAGDLYGWSIAIGGKIFIGAPKANVSFYGDAGRVWSYDLNFANEVEITRSSGEIKSSAQFGFSIAAGTDKVVIGAYRDSTIDTFSGAVFVYNLDGTGEVKIIASDGANGDQFGHSVAIAGNRIIVGAPFDDDPNFNTGSAYTYNLEDGTDEIKLSIPDDGLSNTSDFFGFSVAGGSDGKLYIGSEEDPAGSVLVYNPVNTYFGNFSWGRFSTLTRATSPQSYTVSGNTVSGLSTYPQIQRRGYGLNDSGAYSN